MHDLIGAGRAKPAFIASHTLSLDEARKACKNFDERNDGWTKMVPRPPA